jgi:poly-gamma-glutamate synthesis protein (capsule biosynthesis protein)
VVVDRRDFLRHASRILAPITPWLGIGRGAAAPPPRDSSLVTLLLAGDLMTGRAIDQILPHPGEPTLYEPYVKSATRYLELAEQANGPISRSANFSYIWGDAIDELDRIGADIRIVNLETAVTRSNDYWKGKSIHDRMHPENVPCITAAKIDCCTLANNHVLDWGYSGLAETLSTLTKAKVKTAGAGLRRQEAGAPAILELPGPARVIVFSYIKRR